MNEDSIRTLQQIESVGNDEPYRIVLVKLSQGTAMTAEEVMAAKVGWAERIGFSILTRSVSSEYWPYNAIIRINGANTEDRDLDYLAQFGEKLAPDDPTRGRRRSSSLKETARPAMKRSASPA